MNATKADDENHIDDEEDASDFEPEENGTDEDEFEEEWPIKKSLTLSDVDTNG